MEQSLDVIPSLELDHVTGGYTKEPSPSGDLPGGGAGGWSMSKDELDNRKQYCNGPHPDDDPFGVSARKRQKECNNTLLPGPKQK